MATPSRLPFECEYRVPDASAALHEVISRWSDSRVEKPAIVVIPQTEADIVTAIEYAKLNGLRVVPGNGGHGSFVTIDGKTLYLDMKKFDDIALDKAAGVIHLGGGAVVGDVVKAACEQDYYTLWPNSNAVGMIGCVLGGGSNILNGLHGFMIDNVLSFRLITGDGKMRDLSASSSGEELALFNALCGAGHGFGVVTSLTIKAFPLTNLRMPENKIWVRRLIFAPTALAVAAKAFTQLQPPVESLGVTMLFMRAPPGSPSPGAPMIMLNASYYGPSDEAEKATRPLFSDEVVGQAIRAETAAVPFANANAAFEAINKHGGYKDITSCFLKSIDTETIEAGYKEWFKLTEENVDAKPTASVYAGWNTKRLEAVGQTAAGRAKYFQSRDRGLCIYALKACTEPNTAKVLETYGDDFLRIHRQKEVDGSRAFVNNFRPGMDLREIHTEDKIAELQRLKKLWDGHGVFWSPYGGN